MKASDQRLNRVATSAEFVPLALKGIGELAMLPAVACKPPPAVGTLPDGDKGRGVALGANPGPKIIIDTRERASLRFLNLPSQRGTLTTGDYSVAGWEEHFAIERKSVADLAASLTRERERFARECHRLRGFDFARLLVVGSPDELARLRGNVNPKSVLAGLAAFEIRYRLAVVWEPTPEAAALRVERWAWFFHREMWKPFAKPPVTPASMIGA